MRKSTWTISKKNKQNRIPNFVKDLLIIKPQQVFGYYHLHVFRRFVRMRNYCLFVLLLSFCGISYGQGLELKKSIAGEFDFMTTDHIGRLYLTKGYELFLYSSEGDLMYQYSDLSRGEITHLDTRNPMKLLLYYPDYGQITLLDNTLSKTRDNIDLNALDLSLSQLACASFDNGFWVYDPVSFRLIRFDQGLNVTNEISNVNQLVGAEINPNQMVEFENWLYLNDPKHGIFVFDSFGTYSKLISIKGANRIQVRANGVFLELEDKLIKYNSLNFEQVQIDMPVQNYRSISIEKDRLYILQDDKVLMFSSAK